MNRGSIPLDALLGPFDLQLTLESGQTYLWTRRDSQTYEDAANNGGSNWYLTEHDGCPIRVRQHNGTLEWAAPRDVADVLHDRLGLGDDYDAIRRSSPDHDLIAEAFDRHAGLRIVRDPFFPCLVSFICSAQMRVRRIFEMQATLRRTYGHPLEWDCDTVFAFPRPERLASLSEADLRDLGLGYRAPYVRQTAEMVASGELDRSDVEDLPYEQARDRLTEFVGVGEKVADCVCLFSLGHLQAVPLDTWIRTAIEEHYPDCSRGSYGETSRAIRERFGGEYAGYVQTHVFHHLRTRE